MPLLRATTVQSSAVKLLIDGLKDVLNEVNIRFDATGMRITTMDIKRVALIHVVLEANQFDFYECANSVTLGVHVLNIQKLVKTLTSHDAITFEADAEKPESFRMIFSNEDRHVETSYTIKTLDLPAETITIPDVDVAVSLTMRSVDLQKVFRDMCLLAEEVIVRVEQDALIIRCDGDFAKRRTVIRANEHGLVFAKTPESPIEGRFSLKYLNTFLKSSNLSNTVDLFMKDSFPIILRFNVVDLGEIRYILAPVNS